MLGDMFDDELHPLYVLQIVINGTREHLFVEETGVAVAHHPAHQVLWYLLCLAEL